MSQSAVSSCRKKPPNSPLAWKSPTTTALRVTLWAARGLLLPLPCTAEIRLMRSLSAMEMVALPAPAATVWPAGAASSMRRVSGPSSRASSSTAIARSTLAAPAGISTEAGRALVRSPASASPAPVPRLIGTVRAARVEPLRLMRRLAPSPDSLATASMAWIETSGSAGGVAADRRRSSMARPWSLPGSLISAQRSQRVASAAQGLAERSRLPPTPATRPALLPSTAPAGLPVTGEVQLKLAPGVDQRLTCSKLAPKPHCSSIVWAAVLPPLRHCSPLKARSRLAIAAPVVLLRARANQPATDPLAGEPKKAPPEPRPPRARSTLPVAP